MVQDPGQLGVDQERLHSGIKTQSVSRELFDVSWGLSVVRLVPARGDWLQPQVQKAQTVTLIKECHLPSAGAGEKEHLVQKRAQVAVTV